MPTIIRSLRIPLVLILLGAVGVGCGCTSSRFRSRHGRVDGRDLAAGQTAEIQIAMGRSLEVDGDFDKAMAAYREAARNAPNRPEPQIRMAVLLDRLGRFAEAAPHYEAALKASPGDAEIFADRGYSLSLQGRDAEAEAALRQAVAVEPRLARAHNNLGALLARAGRTADALAEFRKAGGGESEAQLNLAFALGQGRRWDEAKKHLEIAKRSAPSSKEAGEEAARLEALIVRAEAGSTDGSKLGPPADRNVLTAGGAVVGPPASIRRR